MWLEKNKMCQSKLCLQQFQDCESFWVRPQSYDHWGGCGTFPATVGIWVRDLRVAVSSLPEFRWARRWRVSESSCAGCALYKGSRSKWAVFSLKTPTFEYFLWQCFSRRHDSILSKEKECATTLFNSCIGSQRGHTFSTKALIGLQP